MTDAFELTLRGLEESRLSPEASDLYDALRRLAELTPQRANAATAQDLHLTVKAIAESAMARARGEDE